MPVKFYLFTRPDKQSDHPINVSISLFGERLCTSIGYGISPSKWDEAKFEAACRIPGVDPDTIHRHANRIRLIIVELVGKMDYLMRLLGESHE